MNSVLDEQEGLSVPTAVRVAAVGNDDAVREEKRSFIARLFATISSRYDLFNRLASCGLDQRWRRQAIRVGAVASGMDVLDVCTGTGDLALVCAEQSPGYGTVVGLDFTDAMLRLAKRKAQRRSLTLSWVRADAQALPFATGRFDRVLIGFSTRNLSDLLEGLREMIRVLKPSGFLVILETGRPRNPFVRLGYHLFLQTVARTIGWVLTGRCWPFTYLARSVQSFVSPPQLVRMLESCGTSAQYRPLSWGLASLYVATKLPSR